MVQAELKKVNAKDENDKVVSEGFAIVRKVQQGKEIVDLWVTPTTFETKQAAKEFAEKHGIELTKA